MASVSALSFLKSRLYAKSRIFNVKIHFGHKILFLKSRHYVKSRFVKSRLYCINSRNAVLNCVGKEKEVNPIIGKCHDGIQSAMKSINPNLDTEMVIERFKSGDVPPGDFKFEDMHDPAAMLAQDALSESKATNLNLYQKKKGLEKNIEEAEKELDKKQRELKSLQQMVQTYKNNPKFGNPKHFQVRFPLGKKTRRKSRHHG